MAKIALINPSQNLEDTYGSLSEEASVLPPLGLCYLANVARSNGHEAKIIDAIALKITNKIAASLALEWGAKYIGITSTTDAIFSAANVAENIKELSNDALVIIGGPHITAVPVRTLEMFTAFDIGVIGEGEDTFKDLIASLESRKELDETRGIVFRRGGEIVHTPQREFIKDLDLLPFPAWDLLPELPRVYRPAITNYKSLPSASLVTSRGCPGQCAFCDTKVFGSKYRVHSADYVLRTVRYLKEKYGIKDICFYDDVFTVFRPRLVEICKGLRDKETRVDWSCQARVNTVDYEMMKIMKDSGCWKIGFGLETGSEDILKLMNKNTTVERAKKAVYDAKRAGLEIEGYFVLGFFGETENTLRLTKEFIMGLDLDIILLSYFLPFPGSPAYPHVREYGRFDEDWKNMNAFDSDRPQFIPYGTSAEELSSFQKSVYRDFYFRPRIIAKYAARMMTSPVYAAKLIRSFVNFYRYAFKPNN